MPMSENESKYPLTTGFIYNECAKRLKSRKKSLNLTDAEIAGDFDYKVVNRILNNRRTRNNVFLVPPAYAKPLVNKLGFNSSYELFWGEADDEQFIETIFCNLLTDILDEWEWNETYWDEPYWSENSKKVEIIEKVLLDDVAYAKVYSSIMPAFEYESPEGEYLPISPFAFVNGDEQASFAERKQIRQNAIVRLFRNTRPIKVFCDLFQETDNHGENRGFSKLNKRLDIFFDKSIMPFLKDNMPSQNSLGLRVHSIAASDLMNYVELGLIASDGIAHGFDSCTSPEYDEILQLLTLAGRDYINKLENLQARLDVLHRRNLGR